MISSQITSKNQWFSTNGCKNNVLLGFVDKHTHMRIIQNKTANISHKICDQVFIWFILAKKS